MAGRFLQRRQPRERTPRCVLAFGFERGKLSLDLGFTGEDGGKWEWEERMEKIITCGVIFLVDRLTNLD
jgi:hypothetical protein